MEENKFINIKHTYDFIKKQIEKVNYKLLSKEYKNNRQKLLIECDNKHKFKLSYHRFQQGTRCLICAGNQKLTYEYIKQQVEKEGYKLLSKKYFNARKKLKLQCNKGHEYLVSYGNFKCGKRCPLCNIISKPEKKIFNMVCSLIDYKVIANDRTQILNPLTNKNLELDIWIPELNKAIEYNGEYWHNKKESIKRDKIKVKQCKEKNIDLLVIQEQDWLNDKENEIWKIENWIIKNIY